MKKIADRIEQLLEKNNYYLVYPLYYPYKNGLFEKAEEYFYASMKKLMLTKSA